MINLAVFVIDDILYYVAVAAALAGTAQSYYASTQAAKQSEMNANAQSQAIGAEQQRQALETEQTQRRKIMEQRRFTAMQENQLSGSGFLSTTGSPLDILADTYTAQQRELHDVGYQNDTNQWGLSSQAQAAIGQGNSQAGAIRSQAGATLLSNLGTTASSSYGSTNKKSSSY